MKADDEYVQLPAGCTAKQPEHRANLSTVTCKYFYNTHLSNDAHPYCLCGFI